MKKLVMKLLFGGGRGEASSPYQDKRLYPEPYKYQTGFNDSMKAVYNLLRTPGSP